MRSKPQVVMAGYIGGINIGDEAIAKVVYDEITRRNDVEVIVLSGQPDKSAAFFGDESTQRMKAPYPGKKAAFSDIVKLATQIYRSKKVYLCGGGLLQDVHSMNLISNTTLVASLGHLFKKPVIALGLGVGPINSGPAQNLLTAFCQCCDFTMVRDQLSFDELKRLAPKYIGTAHLGADSIFLHQAEASFMKSEGNLRIGICYRDWPTLKDDQLVQLISRLIEDNHSISLLAYEHSDIEFYNRILTKTKLDLPIVVFDTFTETCDVFSELDGIVSMRLHANLLAMLYHVPFIAIAYDPKVSNVISEAGYPHRVFDITTDTDAIASQLQKVLIESHTAPTEKIEQVRALFLQGLATTTKATLRTRYIAGLAVIKCTWILCYQDNFKHITIIMGSKISFLIPGSIKQKIKKGMGIKW